MSTTPVIIDPVSQRRARIVGIFFLGLALAILWFFA